MNLSATFLWTIWSQKKKCTSFLFGACTKNSIEHIYVTKKNTPLLLSTSTKQCAGVYFWKPWICPFLKFRVSEKKNPGFFLETIKGVFFVGNTLYVIFAWHGYKKMMWMCKCTRNKNTHKKRVPFKKNTKNVHHLKKPHKKRVLFKKKHKKRASF